MLKIPASEVKRRLIIQSLISRYSISDPKLIDFVRASVDDDGEIFIHNFEEFLWQIFDFPYEGIHIPQEVYESHTDGWGYYIHAAIRIPSLLPYVAHPAFIEFTRHIETVHGIGGGNLIEFVYLPDSQIASNDCPIHASFAQQPACFMFGIQDNGSVDIGMTLEFLQELQIVNENIKALIEGGE